MLFFHVPITVFPLPLPSWLRSEEMRTQKLRSHLLRKTQSSKVLPLKPGVGQYIAMHATATARDFFLANFYPSGPFTCIFSKTSPEFFLCWLWLTPFPMQACRIKQVTLLDAGSRDECSQDINRFQNMSYCFSAFAFQNCEQNLSCGLRRKKKKDLL